MSVIDFLFSHITSESRVSRKNSISSLLRKVNITLCYSVCFSSLCLCNERIVSVSNDFETFKLRKSAVYFRYFWNEVMPTVNTPENCCQFDGFSLLKRTRQHFVNILDYVRVHANTPKV